MEIVDLKQLEATGPLWARYQRLVDSAVANFRATPTFFVQCPGRVNIIGEHIDYSGYSVLPMAIEQNVIVAVIPGSNDGDTTLSLANTNSEQYPGGDLKGSLSTLDLESHDWKTYFYCGVLGFRKKYPECSRSLKCLVDGQIPIGIGLSSSSALTCAGVLAACLASQRYSCSMNELAEIAIESEKLAGVECGGMDQSASMLSKKGSALLVSFFPSLKTVPVALCLENDAVFVVANSLVVSEKRLSATRCYNKRVVELRIASALLSRSLNLDSQPQTLRELQQKLYPKLSEAEGLVRLAKEIDLHLPRQTLTRDQVAQLLYPDVSDALKAVNLLERGVINPTKVEGDDFSVYKRARHVVDEALRVYKFTKICEQQQHQRSAEFLSQLGLLMDESMSSCDSLFDCSCPELNEMTKLAREAGAYGSRLTGAGWGGCTVSLVKFCELESFISRLQETYYTKVNRKAQLGAIFVARPSSGSLLFKL